MLALPAQGPEFHSQSPHNLYKTLSMLEDVCNLSAGEVGMGGSLGLSEKSS